MIELYDDDTEQERREFAKKAAECFAKNPDLATFSDPAEVTAGSWFAVRWGLINNCVLVFKLDSFERVVCYQDYIPRESAEWADVFNRGGWAALEEEGFKK